jgi:D-serine deaminase-like pyridoxal phosphate-dependent protein
MMKPSSMRALDTPTVVVDIGRVERNIALMAQTLADRGVALRPHAKTHKNIEIAKLQLAAGAVGLSVATLAEAEFFSRNGVDDLFIAYPIWARGPKGHRLRELHEAMCARNGGGALSVGCDSAEAAIALGEAMSGSKYELPVLIEIDSGGHRSGVPPEAAPIVAKSVAAAGLSVRGVFTHGGHSYGGVEATTAAAKDETDKLTAAGDYLAQAGFDNLVISAGSTPTAVFSASAPVTEERPGTYVFGDRTQLAIGPVGWEGVALTVAATVVSVACRNETWWFAVDAGSKILGSDRVEWLPGYGIIPDYGNTIITRLYEHHGVCDVPAGFDLPVVGQILQIVPNHVCLVVNLVESMLVERDGELTNERLIVNARGSF